MVVVSYHVHALHRNLNELAAPVAHPSRIGRMTTFFEIPAAKDETARIPPTLG